MNLLATRYDIITVDVLIADSFIQRLFGYMFRRKPHYDAILFSPCKSIHTFFMKFNIDVLFLDENMKVVHKIKGLKPGKMIMPVLEATIVIESAEGLFYDIEVGDTLDLETVF